MKVTQRCEFCNTISNVVTIRTYDQEIEKVYPHKCEKLVRVSGTNCKYCNKQVNLEHYEIYNEFGWVHNEESRPVKHQCVSDEIKSQIDMERFIDAHEETNKEYFDRLGI